MLRRTVIKSALAMLAAGSARSALGAERPPFKLFDTHALDLQCTDDEHAQRTVGTHRGDRALELWCGTRKVAYFLPSDEGPQTGS